MGHALWKAKNLLRSRGVVIETHLTGGRPRLEIHDRGRVFVAGYLRRDDDFANHLQAQRVVEQAIRSGQFELSSERLFNSLLVGTNLREFHAWLEAGETRYEFKKGAEKIVAALWAAASESARIVVRYQAQTVLLHPTQI